MLFRTLCNWKQRSAQSVTSIEDLALSDRERLLRVEFFVEADTYETWMLRGEVKRMNQEQVREGNNSQYTWIEETGGFCVVIGYLVKRPVTLHFRFHTINWHFISFWESPSEVTDLAMLREWFKRNGLQPVSRGRSAFCNAMNFHWCLSHCTG